MAHKHKITDRLAGVPTRFLHDCRRTAARTLIRASVPEWVAMLLTGHKSRAIFNRYNIIHEQELHDAGDQLVAYLEQHAQAPPPPARAPGQPAPRAAPPPRPTHHRVRARPRRLAPREAHSRPTARDPATPPTTATHTAAGDARGRLRRQRPPWPGTDRRASTRQGGAGRASWKSSVNGPPAQESTLNTNREPRSQKCERRLECGVQVLIIDVRRSTPSAPCPRGTTR